MIRKFRAKRLDGMKICMFIVCFELITLASDKEASFLVIIKMLIFPVFLFVFPEFFQNSGIGLVFCVPVKRR